MQQKYILANQCIAVALIPFLWPLLALIGCFHKLLYGGPVFFLQRRMGKSGRPFTIWKLPTMYKFEDAVPDVQDSKELVECNDPYVTPFGRLLRNTCIDELPQLLNVCRGDMIFFGPRPKPFNLAEKFSYCIVREEQVYPGIIGFEQTCFDRYETNRGNKRPEEVIMRWERFCSNVLYARYGIWYKPMLFLRAIDYVVSGKKKNEVPVRRPAKALRPAQAA
jgi:lipopolysaccharide/colanic/teichoic acid biosynthesis glycosyltransferase